MRTPLSRPSYEFSPFSLSLRTADTDLRSAFFPRYATFGRRSHASKTHLHVGAGLAPSRQRRCCFLLRETTLRHASGLAASRVGAALLGPGPGAMPATNFYPCRLTSLPFRGAGRSTTSCIRPLAIRRSLVLGRPFCPVRPSLNLCRSCVPNRYRNSPHRERQVAMLDESTT